MAGGSADRERVRVSLSGKSCLVYFRFIRIDEDKQIYLSFRCNFRLEIRMKGQKRVKNFSPMSIPPITVVYWKKVDCWIARDSFFYRVPEQYSKPLFIVHIKKYICVYKEIYFRIYENLSEYIRKYISAYAEISPPSWCCCVLTCTESLFVMFKSYCVPHVVTFCHLLAVSEPVCFLARKLFML